MRVDGRGRIGPFSEGALTLGGRSIYEFMTDLAVRHGAVNLGQGFPDFDGPGVLTHWASEAIRTGHNQYSSSAGSTALRGAISRVLATHRTLDFDRDEEITVTAGASEAIVAALLAFIEDGDEVISFEPFYDYYPAFVRMAGGRFVPVPLVEIRVGVFQQNRPIAAGRFEKLESL